MPLSEMPGSSFLSDLQMIQNWGKQLYVQAGLPCRETSL